MRNKRQVSFRPSDPVEVPEGDGKEELSIGCLEGKDITIVGKHVLRYFTDDFG